MSSTRRLASITNTHGVRRSPRKLKTKTPSVNEINGIKRKVSPRGKRKLDFEPDQKEKPKPLDKKTFYFDLQGYRRVASLKSEIESLGGSIEEFLSKDISCLITNRKITDTRCSPRSQSVPSPAMSIPSPFPPTKSSSMKGSAWFTPSPMSTDSPQSVELKNKPIAQTTRGKNFVQQATITQKKGTSDVLSNARTWGVRIVSLEHILVLLKKHGAQEVAKKPVTAASRGIPKASKPQVRRLKAPFIKIEDRSHKYRPLVKEFSEWPRIYYDSPVGSCPFDPPKSKQEPFKSSKQTSPEEIKKTQDAKKHKKGYCECCEARFEDLDMHLKGEQHKAFAVNDKNYENLDKLINRGTSLEDFITQIKQKHERNAKDTTENKKIEWESKDLLAEENKRLPDENNTNIHTNEEQSPKCTTRSMAKTSSSTACVDVNMVKENSVGLELNGSDPTNIEELPRAASWASRVRRRSPRQNSSEDKITVKSAQPSLVCDKVTNSQNRNCPSAISHLAADPRSPQVEENDILKEFEGQQLFGKSTPETYRCKMPANIMLGSDNSATESAPNSTACSSPQPTRELPNNSKESPLSRTLAESSRPTACKQVKNIKIKTLNTVTQQVEAYSNSEVAEKVAITEENVPSGGHFSNSAESEMSDCVVSMHTHTLRNRLVLNSDNSGDNMSKKVQNENSSHSVQVDGLFTGEKTEKNDLTKNNVKQRASPVDDEIKNLNGVTEKNESDCTNSEKIPIASSSVSRLRTRKSVQVPSPLVLSSPVESPRLRRTRARSAHPGLSGSEMSEQDNNSTEQPCGAEESNTEHKRKSLRSSNKVITKACLDKSNRRSGVNRDSNAEMTYESSFAPIDCLLTDITHQPKLVSSRANTKQSCPLKDETVASSQINCNLIDSPPSVNIGIDIMSQHQRQRTEKVGKKNGKGTIKNKTKERKVESKSNIDEDNDIVPNSADEISDEEGTKEKVMSNTGPSPPLPFSISTSLRSTRKMLSGINGTETLNSSAELSVDIPDKQFVPTEDNDRIISPKVLHSLCSSTSSFQHYANQQPAIQVPLSPLPNTVVPSYGLETPRLNSSLHEASNQEMFQIFQSDDDEETVGFTGFTHDIPVFSEGENESDKNSIELGINSIMKTLNEFSDDFIDNDNDDVFLVGESSKPTVGRIADYSATNALESSTRGSQPRRNSSKRKRSSVLEEDLSEESKPEKIPRVGISPLPEMIEEARDIDTISRSDMSDLENMENFTPTIGEAVKFRIRKTLHKFDIALEEKNIAASKSKEDNSSRNLKPLKPLSKLPPLKPLPQTPKAKVSRPRACCPTSSQVLLSALTPPSKKSKRNLESSFPGREMKRLNSTPSTRRPQRKLAQTSVPTRMKRARASVSYMTSPGLNGDDMYSFIRNTSFEFDD